MVSRRHYMVRVRMSEEEQEWLDVLSKKWGVQKGEAIRRMIAGYLQGEPMMPLSHSSEAYERGYRKGRADGVDATAKAWRDAWGSSAKAPAMPSIMESLIQEAEAQEERLLRAFAKYSEKSATNSGDDGATSPSPSKSPT